MVLGTIFAGVWMTSLRGAKAADDFDALIHKGVELRKLGDDRKAEDYFQRAYNIAKTPRAAAQLGLVEFALQQFVDAEAHLSESLLAHEPWIEDHRKVLESSRDKIRTHLAGIEILGGAADVRIVLSDGRSLALPADHTVWVMPGSVFLRIDSSGSNSVTRSVDAKAGDHMTIDLTPRPKPIALTPFVPPPPAPTAQPEPSPSVPESPEAEHGSRILRIGGIATGAAGIAAGIIGGLLYKTAGDKVDRINHGTYHASDLNFATDDDAGIGLMIGGAVALATGATLYVLGSRDQTVPETHVSFGLGHGLTTAAIGGTF